jgi:hypothetical protein
MRQSLLNTPTPPFQGPAHAIYGDRGPQRAGPDYGARKPLSTPPESLADHIDDAIAKVPGLSAKQRNAVRGAMIAMTRDIGFSKLIHEQASAHAVPMDQGRPL